MKSSVLTSRTSHVIPAIIVGVVCLFSSFISAQAVTPDQFAAMQMQLLHASAQLRMLQNPSPTGEVLGVSTTTAPAGTASDANQLLLIKEQIVALDAKIVELQTMRAQLALQAAQLQTATATSTSAFVVKTDAANPQATTLELSDRVTSGWMDILTFDLDTTASKNSLFIDTAQIGVVVGNTKGGYTSLVAGAELVMDGKTFTSYTMTNSTTTDGVATLLFTIGGNEMIKAGTRMPATLKLRFKALTAANEGATIKARVLAGNIHAHIATPMGVMGALIKNTSSAYGELMTLHAKGAIVTKNSQSAVLTSGSWATHDSVLYTLKFDVTAFNEDVYLNKAAARAVSYTMVDAAGADKGVAATSIAALTTTANSDTSGQYYVVPDGSTATFTLVVKWTPAGASPARALQLQTIGYNTMSPTASMVWVPSNVRDFRTDAVSTSL